MLVQSFSLLVVLFATLQQLCRTDALKWSHTSSRLLSPPTSSAPSSRAVWSRSMSRSTSSTQLSATPTPSTPTSTREEQLSKATRIGKSMMSAGAALFAVSATQPAFAKSTRILPECSDSIIVFRGNGREVIMIGTAHISEDSVTQVRNVIRESKPDVVMIELDRKRIGKATSLPLGFVVPKDQQQQLPLSTPQTTPLTIPIKRQQSLFKNPFATAFTSLQTTVATAAQGISGQLLGKALGQFYNSVEKLGFTAGGEFQAAVEEARAINATILLGDRDVDVTLERLAGALARSDQDKFLQVIDKLSAMEDEMGLALPDDASLAAGAGGISKENMGIFVEQMKQKRVVNSLMAVIEKELPVLYNALIGERDRYMAAAILEVGGDVVGVVGLAHLRGIEKALTATGLKPVSRNCPTVQ